MIRLGPVNFFNYLYQRFIKKNKVLSIRVPGFKYEVSIRNHSSDIPLFAHIFILREYNVTIEGEVKTIIDCGANVGLASLFFLSKFPEADIIAIEPEENNFGLLRQNLDNYQHVTCINKGVWNRTAYLNIVDPGHGHHAFTVQEASSSSRNTVEAISVDDIISEFHLTGIDILKVDIEGSEEQLFLSEPEWIEKVRMIFCEIHENMKPGLTNKMETLLERDFTISMNGEYHVFRRKKSGRKSSSR